MHLVGYTAEVTGLSPNVTEKEIYEFFSLCGKIENLEIFRYGDQICNAYITFRGSHAVETAVLLSGATLGNRCVSISRMETYFNQSIPEDDALSKFEYTCSSSESQMDGSLSSHGEANTGIPPVVTSLIAKGHELGKEALMIAKALDESYHLSSTAATKVGELSNKLGLTDKIIASVRTAKYIDNKYHVSTVTATAASIAGRKAMETATAVVNSSYFSQGALYVSGLLDRASKAAADLAKRGAEK